MLEKREYSSAPEESDQLDTSMMSTSTTRKNKKCKNKRRFSDEQIKQLETMFESESKLEPRTKIQLARELDLQPRQVAIWFQNRRARWKSKQLERDYSLLKANYDTLASQFESLKKEKQSLAIQLQKLNSVLGNENSTDGDSDNGDTKYETEQKPSTSLEEGLEHRVAACSDDENCKNVYFGGEEENELTNVVAMTNRMVASPGNWSTFDSTALLDQACSTSHWWEIWS